MSKKLTIERKMRVAGFLFTVPWIIGFIAFFLVPVIMSMLLSITKISADKGILYKYVGFVNYEYLFKSDPRFIPNLGNTIVSLCVNLLLIIIFSLFVASILSQKFKGRLLARAIFFLPVIIASGVVISYIKGDMNAQGLLNSSAQSSQFQLTVLQNILINAKLSPGVVNFIVGMLNSVFEIPWHSGIQILIFMAGIQTISPSIKEAASIEGATGWEFFWKITFPILTPILQLNIIYTIIDGFTDYSNPIIKSIYNYNNKLDYAYGSALSWVYFLLIFIIIIIVYLITNKRTFSYRD